MNKINEGTKKTSHFANGDVVTYFLNNDFIKAASFEELRNAAKENGYDITSKTICISDYSLGKDAYHKMGYNPSTWVIIWHFTKIEDTDNNEHIYHDIKVILEFGYNELSTHNMNEVKSIKLFINDEFAKNYTENYNNKL